MKQKVFTLTIRDTKPHGWVRLTVTGRDKTALMRAAYFESPSRTTWTAPADDAGSQVSALREGAEVLGDKRGWIVVLRVDAQFTFVAEPDLED